jgi:hypothetical protein
MDFSAVLRGGNTNRTGGTMQYLPGTRVLALIAGLAFAAAGSAYAQDTTETGRATIDTTAPDGEMDGEMMDTTEVDTFEADTAETDTSATRDTTDTSGVQNPPGYRGMERDTTIFPDSAGPPSSAEEVKDQTTGTYDDSAWKDTTGAVQNPAGYRGMERPVGDSAGADATTGVSDTTTMDHDSMKMGHDSTMMGHDSTMMGDTEPKAEDGDEAVDSTQ